MIPDREPLVFPSPKVSVLMSVKDGSLEYLTLAVESILKQTFADFEFLIVNDGCKNRSIPQYLNSLATRDSRVRIFHQENKGLTVSLNRLLNEAKGEYGARMDADDISTDDRFYHQVEYLDANSDIALVGSWYEFISEKGEVLSYAKSFYNAENLGEVIARKGNIIGHPTVMFRIEHMRSIGGYDNRLKVGQDFECWLRLSEKYKLYILRKFLLRYRLCASTLESEKYLMQRKSKWLAKRSIFHRKNGKKDPLGEALRDYDQSRLKLIFVFRTQFYELLGHRARLRREYRLAIREYSNAIKTRPFRLIIYFKIIFLSVKYVLERFLKFFGQNT